MRRFLHWLRATFVSGLLAILPIGATAYILWILYFALDSLLGKGRPIGDAIDRPSAETVRSPNAGTTDWLPTSSVMVPTTFCRRPERNTTSAPPRYGGATLRPTRSTTWPRGTSWSATDRRFA